MLQKPERAERVGALTLTLLEDQDRRLERLETRLNRLIAGASSA